MKKHYTIPFFILHEGCPHKCVFCDQKRITGHKMITPGEVAGQIERYLSTIPSSGGHVEVGFFGGTFTGLKAEFQRKFLQPVQPWLKNGRIHGIRLSTRPDFISENKLATLKDYGVTCIELGVQSMSDKVLSAAKRGHTSGDTVRASKMIVRKRLNLGHQMMLGLPLSKLSDEYYTARMAKELGAREVRIYPAVVMKGTEMEKLWREKKYTPLKEEEAVERAARLILYFEANDIKVIRCGLHPSRGLLDGGECLAGPFHTAFGQKCETRVFALMLDYILEDSDGDITGIRFNPEDEPSIFGFKRVNLARIKEISEAKKDFFRKCDDVPRGQLLVDDKRRAFILDRKTVADQVCAEIS